MPATRHHGNTHTGRVRAHNEDAFLADANLGLFVVCDGVGGRARGEIASQETVEFISDWVRSDTTDIEIGKTRPLDAAGVQRLGALVRGAVQNACYMVHSMGEMDPERRGMSTTASVALVVAGVAIVGWVGDSRVYLARGSEVTQLTDDHWWVQDRRSAYYNQMRLGSLGGFGSYATFGLRGGYSYAGGSGGLSLNLGLIGLEAGFYTVDVGAGNQRVPEQRGVASPLSSCSGAI